MEMKLMNWMEEGRKEFWEMYLTFTYYKSTSYKSTAGMVSNKSLLLLKSALMRRSLPFYDFMLRFSSQSDFQD